jgi:hypothetical protein
VDAVVAIIDHRYHAPVPALRPIFLILLALAAAAPVWGDQDAGSDTPGSEPVSIRDENEPQKAAQDNGKTEDPNRGRFLPIPVFITEPAIGEGLGLALAYFHRMKNKPDQKTIHSPASIGAASRKQSAPPTVTGVFGAYTSNETAAGGIGHVNSFRDDHIRFTGVAAVADVNSTFYLLDRPYEFNLKGGLVYQETRFRLRDSSWFLGVGVSYLDATSTFEVGLEEGMPASLFADDITNVGLAGKLAWDTRDDTAMPNSGQLLDLGLWRYDGAFGGDYDYWNANLKLLSFHQLHEKFVLGGRFEYATVDGQAPFFVIPWVKLRGIPALRYQGKNVATAEIEGRYILTPKWALLGFAGTGAVSSYDEFIDTEQNIYNYGLGVRYKIFDAQNIWVGIDIARGPEESNWYIQVGSAW